MSNTVTGAAAIPPSHRQRLFAAPFFLTVNAFFCVGCANPGPPKAPSLHLPVIVSDLNAERSGNRVLLRWTTPARTTDNLATKGPMTAQICREAASRPGAQPSHLPFCAPVLRLAVVPGPSEVADILPAKLCLDPVLLLSYRIQILNSIERSAGNSNAAFAAAGKAPQPVESLNGSPSEQGAVLDWAAPAMPSANPAMDLVELTRSDLSEPAVGPGPIVGLRPSKPSQPRSPVRGKPATAQRSTAQTLQQVFLRNQEPPSGTVDTTARFGGTFTYLVERIRLVTVEGHTLEIHSEPSAPVTVAMQDTFAPRSPAALASIPGSDRAKPYIDLSWEPNSERDLAGYFVYRQLARPNGDPQGPLGRLTPTPVTTPAYRDVAVSPGQRYIYLVTAVDASGNESAPSAKAQEVVTPDRSQERK